MPKSLSRAKALRLERLGQRLLTLLDPLDALHVAERVSPAPRPLAGEARRLFADAARELRIPLPALDSPLTPGVILTSTLTMLEEVDFLLKQALAAKTADATRQSFPRRAEPA